MRRSLDLTKARRSGTRKGRLLTEGEWRAISPGLSHALIEAGSAPRIVPRAHSAARIAGLWRGAPPILTRPDRIFWPDASGDLSNQREGLAILQHELQHLLDYATGSLTALSYLTRPANWVYAYSLDQASRWSDFGAEQRAQIAEDFWRIEHGMRGGEATHYRRVIPWARRP